jgi:hypothetical protein
MPPLSRLAALLFVLSATAAVAAVPSDTAPSAAAKSRARFSTRFYTMAWNAPDRLDYRYEHGELSLHVQQLGPSPVEQADLQLRVKAAGPGRFPLPAKGAASFRVIGCDNTVGGSSYVQITHVDAHRIDGQFELQGHCAKMPSNSETLRNGRFSLVFD